MNPVDKLGSFGLIWLSLIIIGIKNILSKYHPPNNNQYYLDTQHTNQAVFRNPQNSYDFAELLSRTKFHLYNYSSIQLATFFSKKIESIHNQL